LHQVRDIAELLDLGGARHSWIPDTTSDKWTQSLVPNGAMDVRDILRDSGNFGTLLDWGETSLGIVTGNNRFFTLNMEKFRDLGLSRAETRPVSPPGSRHLRGLSFTGTAWQDLERSGAPVLLFYPDDRPSDAAQAYIEGGLSSGVEAAYKCRVRKPWWRVPLVKAPDIFLTYMNADTPRLVVNQAGARHLNSVHGVNLRTQVRSLGRDLLPISSLNTMTLLGAELVGRSYGGGVLKVEPREADTLPMPSPKAVERSSASLAALRPHLAQALRSGKLLDAVSLVDRAVLIEGCGLTQAQLATVVHARELLSDRRRTRGGNPRGVN
jgi:adenine-specific DNA-methyltransferase